MLTDPLLQAGGRGGLGSARLAVLQGTALVVHAATLELAQQVKEALLVGRRGPGDALRMGVGQCWPQRRPCSGRQPPDPWAPWRGLALPGPTSGPSSATCWPHCPKPTPPPVPAPPPSSIITQPSAILPSSHDMPFPWATHTLPLQPHLHSLKCPCWPSYTPTVVCARARGASNVRTYHQRQGAQLGGGDGSCVPALVGFGRHVYRVLD